jgi:hypothetical protein
VCRIIKCNFQSVSKASLQYPDILNNETLGKSLKMAMNKDFNSYIEGSIDYSDDVISTYGFQCLSDWWYISIYLYIHLLSMY